MELDHQQLEAVNAGTGPVQVIAGPGAGKTRCLVERVARLIESGESQSSILCSTFTKSAAGEMLYRVAKRLGVEPDSLNVRISTLHSLGLSIVFANSRALGYKGQVQVSDSRCMGVLRQLLRERGKPYSGMDAAMARAYISSAKRKDLAPADLVGNATDRRLAQLYMDFEKAKIAENLIQFDDMIFKAWRLLRDNAAVREKYQKKFRWLMVDEFHDVSVLEFRFVACLAEPENNLWCVSDCRQAIYQWRGSDPELSLRFKSHFYPQAREIYVALNYRSRPEIIRLFKETIEPSPFATKEFMDAVQPTREQGDRPAPKFVRFLNDSQEAEYVAQEIKRIRVAEPQATIAALYRMNRQSRILEETLLQEKITYVVRGAASFFRLKEVQAALAFLAFIENHDDDSAVKEIMLASCPASFGLGKSATDALERQSDHWFGALLRHPFQRTQIANAAARLYNTLDILLDACTDEMPVDKQLTCIYNRTGLLREDDAAEVSGDNDRSENLRELLRAAAAFGSRKEFLTYTKSFTGISNTSGAVELLTIHRDKGMEQDFVFLVGADNEILPHKYAQDIEEERRLAYVAVSRAKEMIYVLSNSSPSEFFKRWPAEVKLLEAENAIADK